MAGSGRIRIDLSQLQSGDGSLKTALDMWLAQNGPVKYNSFMSVYFGLIREHGYVDEMAPSEESASARQTRLKDLYNEMQSNLYGAKHVQEAVLREVGRRQGSVKPPEEDESGTAIVVYVPEMTSQELASATEGPPRGSGSSAVTDGAVPTVERDLRGVAASVPLHSGEGPEQFALTPRQQDAESVASGSPDPVSYTHLRAHET